MKLNFKKIRLFEIILVVSIILIPSIEYFNLLFNGLRTVFVLITIWFIFFFFPNPQCNKLLSKNVKPLMALLFFILLCFFHLAFNYYTNYAIEQLINFINYLLLTIIAIFYAQPSHSKVRESILFIILFFLSIQAMISIPYLINNDPLLIRSMASGSLEQKDRIDAIKNGVGTNALYSSIPPFLIYSYSVIRTGVYSKIFKYVLYLLLLPLFFSVLISTFFASILMLILSFFIYQLIIGRNLVKKVVKIILGFLFFIFIISNFAAEFEAFGPVLKKYDRFIEARGDDTGRTDLANVSLKTFFEHPLWGIGVPDKHSYSLIGDHMPWVDLFASYGTFTFIFFLFFLFYYLKKYFHSRRLVKKDKVLAACIVGFIMFIMLNFISPIMFNPLGYSIFLMFYLTYEKSC